jgi:uncharacterized membrane protein
MTMSFRLIAQILFVVFIVAANWCEYVQTGNTAQFVMFLILVGVCIISYYLERKWKDHPLFKQLFKGVTFRTPDSDS